MLDDQTAVALKQKCADFGMYAEGSWHLNGYFAFEDPVSIGSSVSFRNSSLAAFSYMRPFSILHNADVGRYCSIAARAMIGLDQHPTDGLSTSTMFYNDTHFVRHSAFRPPDAMPVIRRTSIGNDVWIGVDALIMPGVKVGDGAVIGAKAVVTKDVAPYSIVVGSPARHLRYRFEPSVVDRLLSLQWWRFDLRSWIGTSREVRTIPLREETLAAIGSAIEKGDLVEAAPRRSMLTPASDLFDIVPL